MKKANNFKNLKVWQKAVDLAVDCYQITSEFPKEERYGLISQINRASVSVATNIAEGAGRRTVKDFSHFLDMSRGSCNEVETLLIIAEKVGMLAEAKLDSSTDSIDEVQRMILGLQNSLIKNQSGHPTSKD